MHGNVWEWCWDRNGAYVNNPPNENPKGGETGTLRVIRGGGWNYSAANIRSAYRSNSNPGNGYYLIGFRLVRQ